MRDRRLQRIEAIVEQQTCMAPECDDRRPLGFSQGRGVRGLRPGLQILNRPPLPPFCHRLRIDPKFPAQRLERSLRSLYCCSDGVRGRGERSHVIARDTLVPYGFLPFK